MSVPNTGEPYRQTIVVEGNTSWGSRQRNSCHISGKKHALRLNASPPLPPAALVQQLKLRFDRPRYIRELLPEFSESRRKARPRREVPMSEQAARKREALKEPVLPHQPGQAAFRAILSEDIQWKPFAAFPPEVRLAVLVGHPSEQGPYAVRVKVPHGVKLMPHWHPEDRIYTVISGVFYIGLGDQFDVEKLVAYPPGAVIILPGNTCHFHWAKSGEYITQVTAIGPLGLEYVNSKDDPRKLAS